VQGVTCLNLTIALDTFTETQDLFRIFDVLGTQVKIIFYFGTFFFAEGIV